MCICTVQLAVSYSLMLERETRKERELRLNQYNLNERSGLACFRLGLWKLSGMRTDAETGK